jgi:hypothetical protein
MAFLCTKLMKCTEIYKKTPLTQMYYYNIGLVWNVDRGVGCILYHPFLLLLYATKCLDVINLLSRNSLANDEITR